MPSPNTPTMRAAPTPPYRPPQLFTGNSTLDAVLTVWYGACDKSGPPHWEDFADLIWHPWFVHLLMAENRSRMKPARCTTAMPVATVLLGLPMWFGGVLPMNNPRTAALSEMTRMVSMRRKPVFRMLPVPPEADGIARRLQVVGMPLAPVTLAFAPYRVERVLFAVVHADKDAGEALIR
jgi:hypothetical protein